MKPPTYDIAIMGAGPVGSALALMLAAKSREPDRIALIGQQFSVAPAVRSGAGATPDPRTLALNQGSRVLLEQIQAWPMESADIRTVHVSQRGRLGRTLIEHAELNVPRLGSVAAYDAVLRSLHHAVERSGITLIDGAPPQHVHGGCVRFEPDSGSAFSSRLLVQSDGARPRGLERQYDQHALLATVRAARPRSGWAYERFTRQGPLAFLPHPHGEDLYSIVWCSPPDEAQRRIEQEDDAFITELQASFGDRLGQLRNVGVRHVFPLSLHAGPSLVNPYTIAIGNAAQTLHPVAGQGLNLGLRDAAQLAQALAPWLVRPEEDAAPLMSAYARRRRADRWITMGVTDFLPRVFSTGNPLVEHAGGLALLAMDAFAPLRAPLARQLLQGLRS
ncbi:FAD-dependent monooxygenase [Parapusillimonas sp. JC17]|uniref:FAD-dependent monooxygenase n=1 Tax=Parapusillimonas sp. JC17 TaxID=3445768 RepID=UPI003F9F90B3